jgi:hypothetical protein
MNLRVLLQFGNRTTVNGSHGGSGSVVSDYGLDDRVIEVRSPTGAEDVSSSPCVQTGSEARLVSYPMGTGGKARLGRDANHSPPSSGRGSVWVGAISPLPPCASMACSWTPLPLQLWMCGTLRLLSNVLCLGFQTRAWPLILLEFS